MQHWHVLFTKPRKEAQVYEQLTQKEIEGYLPLLPPQGRRRSPRPLFPRYLFACIDPSSVSPRTVRWLPGLTSIVSFGGEYAVVNDVVIEHIKRRLAEQKEQMRSPFRRGERVRLPADHPLSGLEATFEQALSGGARARILVEFLGRLAHGEVDTALLASV